MALQIRCPRFLLPILSFLEHAFNPAKGRFRNFLALRSPLERRLARRLAKIVMGAHCGRWERFWAGPKIRDCGALPGVCSSSLCPRSWNSAVRAPGPIPCSEFRNISTRIPETATRRKYDPRSPGDCSKCTRRSAARTGNGLKTFWPTATRDCRKPCCSWVRLARMIA